MCGLVAAFTDSTALEPAVRLAMQRMHRRGPSKHAVQVDAHLLASLRAVPSLHLHPGERLLAGAPEAPLPAEIASRHKSGFGIPVEQWLSDGSIGTADLGSRGWARELVVRYEAGN